MANGQLHPAVPPSSEAIHVAAEEETPLAGVVQGAQPEVDEAVAARTRRREEYLASLQRIILVPPKPFPWWRHLPFLGPDRTCIAVGQPLLPGQHEMLEKSRRPGHFARLALDRRVAADCLDVYNASHPAEKQYEPAPGKVRQHMHFDNGTCWIHGNFVARRRRKRRSSGSCPCSFLPAPRTLFFYEVSYGASGRELVTCTPLVDEPVTESYSVWGFPLGRSERRSGELDTICRTCSRRFEHLITHPGVERKPLQCGHDDAIKVCEMCYRRSVVLHPQVFQFGCHDP